MGSEDKALIVQSKKGRRKNHHHHGKHSHQKDNFVKRDPSKLRCYSCDERGHFSRNCPMNKSGSKNKKNSKIRHHAHTAKDDDPPRKKVNTLQVMKNMLWSSLSWELSLMEAKIGLLTVGLPNT